MRTGTIVSVTICVWFACVAPATAVAEGHTAVPRRGVLVLAHGGSFFWNRTVRRTVRQAQLDAPTAVAFGMGFHRREAAALQQAVDQLERQGVQEIVVVPLLVSSASEVFRQLQYLLGQRPEPAVHHEPVTPVTTHAAIRMPAALDDDPVVAEIVADRARALSRRPDRETLVLVAHGPNTEEDNATWLACLARIGDAVRAQAGFRRVAAVTLRDDAEPAVKEQATAQLRAVVQQAAGEGDVLVVPLLIARGGIESGIPKRLAGLPYRYDGRTLLPDARIAPWLRRRVDETR